MVVIVSKEIYSVNLEVILRTIGITIEMIGNPTIKANPQALNHFGIKSEIKPKLTKVITKDIKNDIKMEVNIIKIRVEYFFGIFIN